MDIEIFYLRTPHPEGQNEFIRIPIKLIPKEIFDAYNVWPLVCNGSVYIEICCGMYLLPQLGLLTNQQLIKFLAKDWYFQAPRTPVLWKHTSRPIQVSLIVDDLCDKYMDKEHTIHLEAALNKNFNEVSTDWKAELFCGIKLGWENENHTIDLSIPGDVKALPAFQTNKATVRPHSHSPIQYSPNIQMTKPKDTFVQLDVAGNHQTHHIVGTALYYARDVVLFMVLRHTTCLI